MSLALPSLLPTLPEKSELLFSSDQTREVSAAHGLEAGRHSLFAAYRPAADRLTETLYGMCPQILELEKRAEKLAGALGNDHRPRPCQLLQACGQIRGLARHRLFPRCAFADEISYDDLSRCDADTGLEGVMIELELRHRRHGIEPRAHRPFCLILVSLRPAEIGQHAVAQELRHVTLIPGDGAGRRVLIAAQHIAQVLRIEPAGKLRRTHEIAEHDRHLTPLRLPPRQRLGYRLLFLLRCLLTLKGCYGGEQNSTVS